MSFQLYSRPTCSERLKPGFTLIELIVVMVLIGIMASMIGPSFLNYSRKQAINQTHQEFQTFLSEAFSDSRSGGALTGVLAEFENNEIKQVEYDYGICCPQGVCTFGDGCEVLEGSEQVYQFEETVKLVEPDSGIAIFFRPPQGDILWNGEVEDDFIDIKLADDFNNERSFRIYSRSGLIDPSPEIDDAS